MDECINFCVFLSLQPGKFTKDCVFLLLKNLRAPGQFCNFFLESGDAHIVFDGELCKLFCLRASFARFNSFFCFNCFMNCVFDRTLVLLSFFTLAFFLLGIDVSGQLGELPAQNAESARVRLGETDEQKIGLCRDAESVRGTLAADRMGC